MLTVASSPRLPTSSSIPITTTSHFITNLILLPHKWAQRAQAVGQGGGWGGLMSRLREDNKECSRAAKVSSSVTVTVQPKHPVLKLTSSACREGSIERSFEGQM